MTLYGHATQIKVEADTGKCLPQLFFEEFLLSIQKCVPDMP